MRKKIFLSAALALSLALGGCVSASMDTEAPIEELTSNSDGSTLEIPKNTAGTENITGSEAAGADISKDNGRHIEASFSAEDPNYFFKIESDIYVPEAPIIAGTLTEKTLDIALIEQHLCGGEKLFEKQNDPETNMPEISYVTENGLNTNNIAETIMFWAASQNSGMAQYSNYRLDSLLSGGNSRPINESDWSEENKRFVEQMETDCQALLEQLTLEGKVYYVNLESGNAKDCCSIYVNALIQGLPLVAETTYLQSNVRMGEPGVNNISFNGLYEVASSEPVSILTVDQVLAIVEQGVKDKTINTYSETLTMELVYRIQVTDNGIDFYPVWCFSRVMEGLQTPLMQLGINAQTGEIDFMR